MSPSATVPTVAGTFSPLRPALGTDGHSYSPALLGQIVALAAQLNSYEQAAKALDMTGSLDISPRQVGRLAHDIGTELTRRRAADAIGHRRRQLPPQVANAPQLAAIEVDGGRMFTREPGCGPGVHQAEPKEDKLGCLLSMQSRTHEEDPQPEPPAAFRDSPRVARLVQRVHGGPRGLVPEQTPEPDQTAAQGEGGPAAEPWRGAPVGLVRTCVATLQDSRAFGPMLAAEAQRRNFYAAGRQVFIGDGAWYNWAIQRGYFPHAVGSTISSTSSATYTWGRGPWQRVRRARRGWPSGTSGGTRSCMTDGWPCAGAVAWGKSSRRWPGGQSGWGVRRLGKSWPRTTPGGCWGRR